MDVDEAALMMLKFVPSLDKTTKISIAYTSLD